MLYKSLILEKADITNRTVTGVASVFGNVDSYGDIVWNGSFNKTIQENRKRIRHLWNHNMFDPPTATVKDVREIDRADLPQSVQSQYPEATGGLLVAREYLNTPRADEILQGVSSGAINEMSFMYDVIKSDVSTLDGNAVYNLRELKLYETSDVVWGANEATVASKAYIQSLLKAGENWIALRDTKQGRVLSEKNLEKLKSAISVLNDVLLSAEPIDDTSTTSIDVAATDVTNSLNKTKAAIDAITHRIRIAQYELSKINET